MGRRNTKKTTDEFIKDARAVHGDRYDYSKVEYNGNKVKVEIICPEHGAFFQAPAKHLSGQGCPKCSRKKAKETCLKHYGVENPRQSKVIANKIQNTVRQKYGVDYVVQSVDVRNKSKETCLEHYGVENPMQSVDVRKKAEATNLERYGVKNSMMLSSVREKAKQTMLSRYGVEHALQNDAIKAQWIETNKKLYGVENPQQSEMVKEKTRITNLQRYGSENPFGSELIMDKIHTIIVDRYGVDYPAQNKEIYQKGIETKRERGTFNSSMCEDILFKSLCDVFGENDVLTQYTSDEYPFRCDFYIKSRNMYVELNGLWTHGSHWFDKSNSNDFEILNDWMSKSENSDYYSKAVEVWSKRDVLKRQCAIDNNLNYIVFWDSTLKDADIWFSLGCPDGNDAVIEYSWLV